MGAPTHTSFPIGEYKLGASTDGLTGLTEFAESEYALMGREFEGEKNYNAPTVEFLGNSWKLMLGTVYGRIYKIAPYLEDLNIEEANCIGTETFHYCWEKLGEPSKYHDGFPLGTGFFIWQTTDGNVILQTVEAAGSYSINLFITSKLVGNFEKPKDRSAYEERWPIENIVLVWRMVGMALSAGLKSAKPTEATKLVRAFYSQLEAQVGDCDEIKPRDATNLNFVTIEAPGIVWGLVHGSLMSVSPNPGTRLEWVKVLDEFADRLGEELVNRGLLTKGDLQEVCRERERSRPRARKTPEDPIHEVNDEDIPF
jgi:hypothetical protein